jgi:hypothetical protein
VTALAAIAVRVGCVTSSMLSVPSDIQWRAQPSLKFLQAARSAAGQLHNCCASLKCGSCSRRAPLLKLAMAVRSSVCHQLIAVQGAGCRQCHKPAGAHVGLLNATDSSCMLVLGLAARRAGHMLGCQTAVSGIWAALAVSGTSGADSAVLAMCDVGGSLLTAPVYTGADNPTADAAPVGGSGCSMACAHAELRDVLAWLCRGSKCAVLTCSWGLGSTVLLSAVARALVGSNGAGCILPTAELISQTVHVCRTGPPNVTSSSLLLQLRPCLAL